MKLYCIWIFLLLAYMNFVAPQKCKLSRNNEPGECMSIHKCPKVQNDLQVHRVYPDLCGFQESDPIICCPKERISAAKCKEQFGPKFTILREKRQISAAELDIVYHPTVVGGTKTAIAEFPYMAAIGWRRSDNTYEFKCGGFLVEKTFVVTAAHCVSLGGAYPEIVRTGGDPLTVTTVENIPIDKIYVHPQYRRDQNYHDIAIIELTKNSSHLQACLWQSNDFGGYQKATAIGYGHVQFGGSASNDLLKAELNLYNNSECVQYYGPQLEYPSGLIESQLCAGDPGGLKDTCQGDSGGPILFPNTLHRPHVIGLTSFGSGCAGQAPSIYTRISSYLDWIESIVWK